MLDVVVLLVCRGLNPAGRVRFPEALFSLVPLVAFEACEAPSSSLEGLRVLTTMPSVMVRAHTALSVVNCIFIQLVLLQSLAVVVFHARLVVWHTQPGWRTVFGAPPVAGSPGASFVQSLQGTGVSQGSTAKLFPPLTVVLPFLALLKSHLVVA